MHQRTHTLFSDSWPQLIERLLKSTARLYHIHAEDPSQWKHRKLMAFKDSQEVFFDLDHERAEERIELSLAWRLFTGEVVDLYLQAARRDDGGYGAGLLAALDCQRGFAPEIDALPLPDLLAMRGIVL